MKSAKEVRRILHERFPVAFTRRGAKGVKGPLMIGIEVQVKWACPELTPAEIDAGLHEYTNGERYLAALVAGAERVNLNGQPTGEIVTPAQAILAARQLKRLVAKRMGNHV